MSSNFGPWVSGVALALVVLGNGCGSDDNSDGGWGAAAGSAGGPDSYVPLPVKAACAAPAVTQKTVTPPSGYFASPALAWSGSVAGLAFFERTNAGESSASAIYFQPLDGSGEPLSEPFGIGIPNNSSVPNVSIATNRQTFMVCWSGANDPPTATCAEVVDAKGHIAKSGPTVPGSNVRVTWGVGGYVVVYSDPTDKKLKARRLASDASAQGPVVDIGVPATTPPSIAPLGSAFAFVGDGAFVNLSPSTLQPTGDPITLTMPANPAFAIATTQDETAIAIGGGAVTASVIAGDATSASTAAALSTGSSSAREPGLTGAEGSFAAAWGSIDKTGRYRGFDATGQPIGASESVVFDDGDGISQMAIVAVADGFIVAGTHYTSVVVAHLGCP